MNISAILLLFCTALSFYGLGMIWAMEMVTLRTWTVLHDKETFHQLRSVHWRALPFLVFIPIGILFISSVWLLWYHPAKTPINLIVFAVGIQMVTFILTAMYWGRWERLISVEQQSPQSNLVRVLIKTHWIRTALVSLNAILFFLITVFTFL
jgi:hypothetical protein